MNIFVLDKNLRASIQMHIDRHVIKMPLEAAQMLSTNYAIDTFLGYRPEMLNKKERDYVKEKTRSNWEFYKPTHINHPCTIWGRTNLSNYNYIYNYCQELNEEKLFRWPKNPPHKSALLMQTMPSPVNLPEGPQTPIALCMFEEYKDPENPIESYRAFYYGEKQFDRSGNSMARWTNRKPPEWWY